MGNIDRNWRLLDYNHSCGRRMPKAFLMSGKRKIMDIDQVCKSDGETSSDDCHSPVQVCPRKDSGRHYSGSEEDEDTRVRRDAFVNFSPSPESAFSKIRKLEPSVSSIAGTATSTASLSGTNPGFYPSFYPALFPYPYAPLSAFGSMHSSAANIATSPGAESASSEQSGEKLTTSDDMHDRNMYYYVDPRIPFTNYFLNLTKLLQNSAGSSLKQDNKASTVTTPLGRIGGEESRAEGKETPMAPDSTKPSPDKRKPRDDSPSPNSSFRSGSSDIFSKQSELKVDVSKINTHTFPEARFPNPFTGNLLQTHQNAGMVPLPGGGLFHPAMMSIPGHGYRRFNPEKPPPVKKYKCDVCGKAFSRSNTLVTHKRIHTGDKPFKCEICNRAFRQPGNLTRHRLTHTTVKPYVCPSCNKAFNRASNLHTHMRTHTSFKAYVCPYCGKGFHQKIDMKIHCYTHTAHAARDLPSMALN